MGYTHHYTQKKRFSPKKWHAFTEFVEKLSHYKPTICGPDGTGHPVITENNVMFNGDDGVDEAYETFHVSRVPQVPEFAKDIHVDGIKDFTGMRFCKTNRKPYDASVVACLIFIVNMDKNIMKIRSDGRVSDWHEGYHLCKAVYPHMDFTIPDLE